MNRREFVKLAVAAPFVAPAAIKAAAASEPFYGTPLVAALPPLQKMVTVIETGHRHGRNWVYTVYREGGEEIFHRPGPEPLPFVFLDEAAEDTKREKAFYRTSQIEKKLLPKVWPMGRLV